MSHNAQEELQNTYKTTAYISNAFVSLNTKRPSLSVAC